MFDVDAEALRVLTALFHGTSLTLALYVPWLIVAGYFISLWFYGEEGAVATRRGRLSGLVVRRNLILTYIALLFTLILALTLQDVMARPRPIASVIPHPLLDSYALDLQQGGSYPNLDIAMIAVLVTGAFHLRRWLGLMMLVLALMLGFLQMGTGLAWFSDVFAGAAIGTIIAMTTLYMERIARHPLNGIIIHYILHPRIMYSVSFLLLVESALRFPVMHALMQGVL